MTRRRPRLPRWLSAVALLAVALGVGEASGQGSFRLTHSVDRSNPSQLTVTGRVFNDARADAVDVYVTAEALDDGGRVVGTGVSYVGTVPAGSSSAFAVKVPSPRAARFRVLVTSFRFGFSVQS